MKAAGRLLGMAAIGALAACASGPAPAPPVVEVIPPPLPAPAPTVEPTADWRDVPLSPGDWHYESVGSATEAWFDGAEMNFSLRCDPQRRQILLSRGEPATAAADLTIRTSSGTRTMSDPAAVPASDPFLDAIVFSRGRFTVEGQGLPTLIVPAWPEPGRVVEDCRN